MRPRILSALTLWRALPLLVAIAGGIALAATWRTDQPASPDVGALYEQGLAAYREGDFTRAVDRLSRAHAIEADDVGVNTLLGWSHWRLGQVKQARAHFERAVTREGAAIDAQAGLGLASLALDDLETAVPLLERAAGASPADRDIVLALATAYVRSGANRKAAGVYRDLLRRDPADEVASREFLGMFGYPAYREDLPLDVPDRARPPVAEQWFRARGDRLQALGDAGWRDVYLVGANLGPARPGEFPSTMSRDYAPYAQWLREMAEAHANTLRVYTILPPAFYRALADHNRSAASPLWLIQEIWINDEARDLYDPRVEQEFLADLEHVIDLLHGRGDVPFRRGAQYGLYTADVSRWVIGIAVGREIEPHLALRTDARNPARTSHAGRYVALPSGTPTEAWLARMCDRAVEYEVATYNAQRPITVVSWPPLDTLTHPAEASFVEEIAVRQARGEPVSADSFVLPDHPNDADVASVDVTRLRVTPAFTAGLFALYHVYQHWPDFMFHEPAFARARDALGPNRYLGYLQALKRVYRGMPLVIGEYGVATSLVPAHLHPDGWHNGGLSEAAQADLLVRFTRNHHEAGAAGSIVFSWKDEWWKKVADRYTGDFEVPRDRDPLWFNALDPEEAFGLLGYEPEFAVPLLRGRDDDWQGAQVLAGGAAGGGPVQGVRAMADYTFLYLRLEITPGALDWRRAHLWVVLNTLPGEAGSRTVPETTLRLAGGASFLLQLAGPDRARVIVAGNAWPNHVVTLPGTAGETRVERRTGFTVTLDEAAPFVEMITEANHRRFARDGRFFPALTFNRSPLRHGVADRASAAFDDQALWHADLARGLIELRLPWGLLLVTDPSSRLVLGGVDGQGTPVARTSPGVSVGVLALAPETSGDTRQVIGAWPALAGADFASPPPVFAWPTWTDVRVRPYRKRAFGAISAVFADLARRP